jgi:hypothetical protein
MPSAMLEQEAQMFGFRERVFPFSGIGSPQHRQIREFMRCCRAKPERAKGVPERRIEGPAARRSTHGLRDIALQNP